MFYSNVNNRLETRQRSRLLKLFLISNSSIVYEYSILKWDNIIDSVDCVYFNGGCYGQIIILDTGRDGSDNCNTDLG